jgi:hypothetical protein
MESCFATFFSAMVSEDLYRPSHFSNTAVFRTSICDAHSAKRINS